MLQLWDMLALYYVSSGTHQDISDTSWDTGLMQRYRCGTCLHCITYPVVPSRVSQCSGIEGISVFIKCE